MERLPSHSQDNKQRYASPSPSATSSLRGKDNAFRAEMPIGTAPPTVNRHYTAAAPMPGHSMYDTYYTASSIAEDNGSYSLHRYHGRTNNSSSNGGSRSSLSRNNDTDRDKATNSFNGASSSFSHARSSRTRMFSPTSDPLVQTPNRLKEDYSRKIHCYISEAQEDGDNLPQDGMPPPVLPLLGSISEEQPMPFWRPPPVLQRDPHYNSMPPLPNSSTTSSMASPPTALYQSPLLGRQYRHHGASVTAQAATNPPIIPISSPASLLPNRSVGHQRQRQRQQQQQQQRSPSFSRMAKPPSIKVDSSHNPSFSASDCSSFAAPSCSNLDHRSRHSSFSSPMPTINTLFSSTSPSSMPSVASEAKLPSLRALEKARPSMPLKSEIRTNAAEQLRLPPIGLRQAQEQTHPPYSLTAATRLHQPANGTDKTRESMSIASLVDDTSSESTHHTPLSSKGSYCHSNRQSCLSPSTNSRKRSYGVADAAMSLHKMARTANYKTPVMFPNRPNIDKQQPSCLPATNQVVITCYHASVAQKSYGGEKRFLCPPPAVLMQGEGYSAHISHHSSMLLSVTTDSNATNGKAAAAAPVAGKEKNGGSSTKEQCPSSSAHAPLECQTSFNERNVALFRSLHVTGMQKAKSFRLRLDLLSPTGFENGSQQLYMNPGQNAASTAATTRSSWHIPDVYASLESNPVAIISKPSKKTAKSRNQSTCIRSGSRVSLFNRINSQTFRTKYLNVDHTTNRWVAQSHNWSPFKIELLSQEKSHTADNCNGDNKAEADDQQPRPLYYGAVVVLAEPRRNFRSPPMIIRKVERGRHVENANSPVSQMQKVALQLKPTSSNEPPRFLKADSAHYNPVCVEGTNTIPARFDEQEYSPELAFEEAHSPHSCAQVPPAQPANAVTTVPPPNDHNDISNQELDDAFCWTIVGISGFTYSYSLPLNRPLVIENSCGGRSSDLPRVNQAWIEKMASDNDGDGTLLLCVRTQHFYLDSMELLLDGTPLVMEDSSLLATLKGPTVISRGKSLSNGATTSTASNQNHRNKTSAAASLNKSIEQTGDLHVAQLPKTVGAGMLSIRKADGVLYDAKWMVKPKEGVSTRMDVKPSLEKY